MIVSNGSAVATATAQFPAQALAEAAPLIGGATGYFASTDGQMLGNHFATYSHMYRTQPWIATLVDKIASSAARLSFVPWMDTPDGKVEDTTSAWATLWQRPCPLMPSFAFWRWTFAMIELHGEAFWVKVRQPDGTVTGFVPMHPSRTQIERDKNGAIVYRFDAIASAGMLELPETDVVPFRRWDPDGAMRGMSRIEPLRSTLENEHEARRSTSSWWKRGARPSLMLSSDAKLSDKALMRLKAQVEASHAGSERAAGTLVLEEGMKPVKTQLSAEEMQYIESRKLNREECCAVYDVPPPVVHILDRATFSNITEQMRSMYRDTMAPRLEDVESTIDHYVRFEDFIDVTQPARFALDEVLRGDFEKRAESYATLVQAGIVKPSEARTGLDLPDAGTVANRLYANSALQPLGSAPDGTTNEVADPAAVAASQDRS